MYSRRRLVQYDRKAGLLVVKCDGAVILVDPYEFHEGDVVLCSYDENPARAHIRKIEVGRQN